MAARYQSLQRDKPRAADFQEDRGMQAGPGRSEVAQSYATVAQVPARVAFRRAGRMSVGRAQLLNVLEMTLEPLVLVLSLWGVALLIEGQLRAPHMILALIVFSLTFRAKRGCRSPPGARSGTSCWDGWRCRGCFCSSATSAICCSISIAARWSPGGGWRSR